MGAAAGGNARWRALLTGCLRRRPLRERHRGRGHQDRDHRADSDLPSARVPNPYARTLQVSTATALSTPALAAGPAGSSFNTDSPAKGCSTPSEAR